MKNKGLFLLLVLGGIIVYFGLLVAPGKITLGNIILFVIYVAAASFLIMRRSKENKENENE